LIHKEQNEMRKTYQVEQAVGGTHLNQGLENWGRPPEGGRYIQGKARGGGRTLDSDYKPLMDGVQRA